MEFLRILRGLRVYFKAFNPTIKSNQIILNLTYIITIYNDTVIQIFKAGSQFIKIHIKIIIMEENRRERYKRIQSDTDDPYQHNSKSSLHIASKLFLQSQFIHVGSLICWGLCRYQFHTDGLEQELINVSGMRSEHLSFKLAHQIYSSEQIFAYLPFSMFFSYIPRTKIGQLKFYCQIPKVKVKNKKEIQQYMAKKQQLQKQLNSCKKKKQRRAVEQKIRQNQYKITASKHRAKKVISIRMQIYMSRKIYNEISSQYENNLKKLDSMQSILNTLKASSQQYKQLKNQMENLIQEQLHYQKVARSLLLYLMEKAKIKVLNRSFIKPPPKLNYLMRQYRRLTIGLITKNRRAERRILAKIARWKRQYETYTILYPCIGPLNEDEAKKKYYHPSVVEQMYRWNLRDEGKGLMRKNQQIYKFQVKMGIESRDYEVNRKMAGFRKLIMDQIGAYGFGDEGDVQSQSDQEQNQASKKSMDVDEYKLMKKNQALMQKFQTQNKYFKIHPTPQSMISKLKPYQGQALQWMKYREGKISVQELFQPSYKDQINDFEFQRKLSPFWEEMQLPDGQKFYVNYLTGEFTQKFHDWKSIRGGILADQMGLGKTVMTLSLLADEGWQGLNLIVVPVAVLLQWKEEIKKHCGMNIQVYQFHSDSKNRRKKNLDKYNIVLITYATLGHEYRHFRDRNVQHNHDKFIFEYDFQRVILDEAHSIRGTNTLQFNAVMNLKTKYSWCLTGTLIQNSDQDLFAIFKFLRVEVFSEEAWWNQYIKNAGCIQAKLNVIQTVLRPIVLRRTKASTSNEGQSIITLTKKIQITIRPSFSPAQARIYEKLENGVRKFFRSNIQAGRNYTHVFQILSKLRQFCCHPALIFGSSTQDIQDQDVQQVLNKFLEGKVSGTFKQSAVDAMLKNDENCVICLTEPGDQNAVLTQCGHYFCQPCLKRTISINPNCPICRKVLTSTGYIKKSDFMIGQDLKDLSQSSKMIQILKTLQQIYDRQEKCVIFTQWIKIIGLLTEKLLLRGIEFETIMGDMTPEKRQRAIKRFRQKPQCSFMIVSIRAGAVGLNLAFANNVMICDPWWNPSHQEQAIGRVHRIGQTKDVNVYRFIMKKSIEQKIEKMHEGKRRLANQVMMQKGSLQNNKPSGTQQLIRLLES